MYDVSELNGRVLPTAKKQKTVAFDDAIPAAGPELFIKRLAANESRQFCVLGTKIRGIWVHWNPRSDKSEPHYEGECASCAAQMPKRWKGFLHVYEETLSQEMFLELTPTSAAALMERIDSPDQLRGAVITVQRGKKNNSRLNLFVQPYRRNPQGITPEKDPRRSILKLWGCLTEKAEKFLDQGGDDVDPEE
jgi:hypothetical protein